MNRINARRGVSTLIVSSAVLAAASVCRAQVSESNSSSATQTNFDGNILNNDLIENGSAAVIGVATTGSISGYAGDVAPGNSWANLTDGQASTKVANNDISHDTYFDGAAMNSGASITYTFSAALNPNGLTLSKISSISGWADTTTFANQKYLVSIAPINAPTNFKNLTLVNYAPFTGSEATADSSQVTLQGSSGSALATNVGAIRFTILNNGGSGQVFRELDVSGAASTTAPPPPPPPVPTILPLGDSITYGDQGVGGPVPGGYRTKLYTDLHNANFSFNYVGSQTSNASSTLSNAGQVNNEGHDGYRIDQIANNLTSEDPSTNGSDNGGHWLDGGNGTGRSPVVPTYTLLHIGTNDILQHYDTTGNSAPEATFMTDLETRLHDLVAQLIADRPSSKLLVSSIIPIPNHTNGNGVDENTEVKEYNAYIQDTLVPEFKNEGVYFVDQYDNFVDSQGNILTNLLPDSIHPNQTGYDLMGDTWAAAIQSVPEPGTLGALAVFGAGLLARRRRR